MIVWAEGLSLSLRLAEWQQYGLAFLLGSFAVATWSDLKHLSAQREFVEIWLAFLLAILAFDVWHTRHLGEGWEIPSLKWFLIVVFSVVSLRQVGVLFRLAPADVAALAAAASLLPPALVVLFYLVAKVLSLGIAPLLARGRRYWPFMPVVTLATLAVLVLGWLW
jgi:hypothetical protein